MLELTGTILLKRYRIEELLGRGGMAEVYLATDLRRRTHVAIKVLREDLAEGPKFVRLYQFVQQGVTTCVVMDYIKEITLRRPLIMMRSTGALLECYAE